jgi:hypothetical protein
VQHDNHIVATMGSMGEPLQFQEPTIVKLSDDERTSGCMDVEHIAEAVIAFHRDGFVVLENVIDPEHCEKLDVLMCEEANRMATDPKTIWNDVSSPTAARALPMLTENAESPRTEGETIRQYAACATVAARTHVRGYLG